MNNEWILVSALAGALVGQGIAVVVIRARDWLASRKAKKAGKV